MAPPPIAEPLVNTYAQQQQTGSIGANHISSESMANTHTRNGLSVNSLAFAGPIQSQRPLSSSMDFGDDLPLLDGMYVRVSAVLVHV